MAQRVKRPPAMWEIRVRSLGQEEPLEKEMATHSGALAWKIPWTEKPGRLHGVAEWDTTEQLQFHFPLDFKTTASCAASLGRLRQKTKASFL